MRTTARVCPDCKTNLDPIQVIDQLGHGGTRLGLAFTRGEPPETSGWTGKLKNQAGTIEAFLCDQCGRVVFYEAR